MSQQLSYVISKTQGFIWKNEVTAIKDIAKQLPPNPIVVCIGAGPGTFSLAVAEERQDARIYSVDILNCTGERLNMDQAGYGKQLIQIIGDSKEVWKTFTELIDFLFIDGDHSYASVLADIDGWLPKVKKNGVIGFHDYRPVIWQEVKDAVDLRMGKKEKVLHVDNLIVFRV